MLRTPAPGFNTGFEFSMYIAPDFNSHRQMAHLFRISAMLFKHAYTPIHALIALPILLALAGCNTPPIASAPTEKPATATGANSVSTVAPEPQKPKPIDMAETGSKPISFQRVIFNIEPGSTIGKVYWGPMKVERDTIKAPALFVGSDQFALIARDELRKSNYTLLGGENLIFGEDGSSKARYQLGAQISKMKRDIYASHNAWTGKSSVLLKGEIGVDWQVMDTLTRKVVFTATTHQAQESGDDVDQQIFLLFRANLRELLADEKFASFMRPESATPAASATNANLTPLRLDLAKNDAKPRILPADFPELLESIIAVKPGVGLGTGFIITSDGYALTAAHVVSGLKTAPVRLASGLILEADVLRVDETADVALIKIPGSAHKPIELLISTPATGTDIFAVGNPLDEGLKSSVSKGIVSGDREIEGRKFLQTDVSANPGSSGGPLLTSDGRAAGVLSWKIAAPGLEGLAFAAPTREALARLNIVFDNP
jgi:S1-C subfamily serine protease